MKDIEPQPAIDTLADGYSQGDIEAIIEQIWDDLGGVASRSEIRIALTEVAPEYEGARVKTYVPIFLRRDVHRRLQNRLTPKQGATTTRPDKQKLKGIG